MEELFREVAVSHSRSRLGIPLHVFGLSSWILPCFLISSAILALGFFATAKFARKETVLGMVVPSAGVERIALMRPGVVKSVLVQEGQTVVSGEPLFVVSYDATLENGNRVSTSVNVSARDQLESIDDQEQAKQQGFAATAGQTRDKIAALKVEMEQISAQKNLQEQRVALLQKDIDAAIPLVAKQFMAEQRLRERQDVLLQSKQSLLQLEETLQRDRDQVTQYAADLHLNAISAKQSDADWRLSRAQLAEKATSNMATQAARIVTTSSGHFSGLQVHVGDLVPANQTLGFVVPTGRGAHQQVELWVPSKAIGFVERGTEVRLMLDAFPYETFGVVTGHVLSVASAPVMPNEIPIPTDAKEQMYRLVVDLDQDELIAYGRKWSLLPGMRLTADLVLSKKSLLSWLLDPLFAAQRRL